MKYGENFQAQSVPQWAPYNVDYNELKNLIKVNTTRDQAQAIAIPGQENTKLQIFEDSFYNELSNQHDRVDLFVRSKADEIERRLQFLQKSVLRLLARCSRDNADGTAISIKRQEKFAKYDNQIEKCGDDIRALQRFVAAQRMAFHKILKKYKKWTGSRSMGEQFNDEVLGNQKSFVRRDFDSLLSQYHDLLAILRASTPTLNHQSAASSRRHSRRPSAQVVPEAPQAYWNEYDDGSEAGGDEPYTVLIDPNAEGFPGEKYFNYFFNKAKKPVESIKAWLSPPSTPRERRPLLGNENGSYFDSHQSIIDTDVEDEAYASSSNEFPTGYATHYATFPSVSDQKFSRHREKMLFQTMFLSYSAALVMLLIAGILVATGRRKLRVEVDAGVLVGVLASLFFALTGLATTLYRRENLSWLHRLCSWFTFTSVCVLDGMLIYIVMGKTGL